MKNDTLLLIGAGVLAYLFLSKNSSASGDSGYGAASQPVFFSTLPEQQQQQQNLSSMLASAPKMGAVSIDLSPVASVFAPNRFLAVQYPGASQPAVLDKFQQQSITPAEAVKRASNPFAAAIQTPYPVPASKGGVGWQNTLKNNKAY